MLGIRIVSKRSFLISVFYIVGECDKIYPYAFFLVNIEGHSVLKTSINKLAYKFQVMQKLSLKKYNICGLISSFKACYTQN